MNQLEKISYILSKSELEEVLQRIIDETIEKHFSKEKEDRLLSINQVCAMLNVEKTTLWRWHKEGYLKKIYIGGKPRYKESDVNRIKGLA